MKGYITKILCLGLVFILGGLTLAEEWTIYGPRAQGMGGAGVAVGDAASAPYWNPAALITGDTKGLYIPVGTTISAEGDILKYVDAVVDTLDSMDWAGISAKIDAGESLTLDQTRQLLDLFASDMLKMDTPGQGLLLNLNGGVMVTVGDIGISANFLGYAGVDPTVDTGTLSFNSGVDAATSVFNVVGDGNDRTGVLTVSGQSLSDEIATIFTAASTAFPQDQAEELVYQAELAGVDTSNPIIRNQITTIAQATAVASGLSSVSVNTSGVTLNALMVKEFGVTYAMPALGELLYIGATIKMMQGETYYKFIQFDDMESGEDIADDLGDSENTETSTTIGLDVGALLYLTENLQVGLTARNLNKPKFDYEGSGDLELDPQFRLGGAFRLGKTVLVAADFDLTKNESGVLDGYESQMTSIGAELSLLGLILRAGVSDNTASDESDQVYTYGLGFHLFALYLDIAAAMSTGEVDIETGVGGSEEMPERASFAFSLAIRF